MATTTAQNLSNINDIGTNLLAAATEYLQRRDRLSHPEGSFDRGRRFVPADNELCACCTSIRRPTRAWPYSLMTHCRTMPHIAELYGVDLADLRREIKRLG